MGNRLKFGIQRAICALVLALLAASLLPLCAPLNRRSGSLRSL
jgi:hypothetical protein